MFGDREDNCCSSNVIYMSMTSKMRKVNMLFHTKRNQDIVLQCPVFLTQL